MKTSPFSKAAFTLVELLVSVAVLVFLVVVLSEVIKRASQITNLSMSRMESDDAARMVMDRIGQDFEKIVKRPDLDYEFRPSATGSDEIYFYAETPGYVGASADAQSNISVVGYKIYESANKPGYEMLNRCAKAMQLTGDNDSSISFLTYSGNSGNSPILSQTMLSAKSVTAPASSDLEWHVLADSVFRMEFCFLLRDGTYSSQPILNTPPSDWNGATFFTAADYLPSSSDGGPTYSVGSRWYDTNSNRGYVCESLNGDGGGQAVWKFVGWRDVSAIVVTIALIDSGNRTLVVSSGGSLKEIAAALPRIPDADFRSSGPVLLAQNWINIINNGGLSMIPQKAASGVRVYQRCFYIDWK